MIFPTRIFLPRTILSLVAVLLLLAPSAFAQQSAASELTTQSFAGTWHWMFQGKSFATMVIVVKGDGVTGSITGASLHTDEDGKITEAIAGTGVCAIIRSSMKDGSLHVVCKADDDEIEWAVKLTSPTTAEIVASGADAPKMEPIRAEKTQ
jgi:hypothetical protein